MWTDDIILPTTMNNVTYWFKKDWEWHQEYVLRKQPPDDAWEYWDWRK
jgi:hypothetical protein